MFIPTELYTKANVDVSEDLETPDPTLVDCTKCGTKGQLTFYRKEGKMYLCASCMQNE